MFLSPLTLCNTPFLTRSVQLTLSILPSTTFQTFPGISDLPSELSKFQHHTQLHSKYGILLVLPQNLSPICWWTTVFVGVKKIYLRHKPNSRSPVTPRLSLYFLSYPGPKRIILSWIRSHSPDPQNGPWSLLLPCLQVG
jgi:hypothetical protein